MARIFGLWLCLLLTGCAFSGQYHVEQRGGAILTPHTVRADDKLVIFVPDVFRDPSRACKGLPRSADGLDIAVRQLWTGGQFHRALRFRGTPGLFASRTSITEAVESWWPASATGPDCLADGAREAIIRSLTGQRPMDSDSAIEQWYGPGTTSKAPRLLMLRAGMRVCAHDVSENSDLSGYRLNAVDCARLIDTKDGPVFDPVVARFAVSLSGSTEARFASSWSEVQQPYKPSTTVGARPAYLLVYSKELPTAPVMVPPAPEAYNYLVAINLADGQGDETALEIVRRLSRSGAFLDLCGQFPNVQPFAFITCIKLGERTTFTVNFPISLNGQKIDMPVGATLQSVLAIAAPDMTSFDLVASSDAGAGDPAARARLLRTLAKARMTRWFDGHRVAVSLKNPAALTLPLQPGDEIQW